jgi:hypothetical protein
MIQGAFANGTIVYPPYTSGNLYIIDGTPTTEADLTVSFKLKAVTGEALVTAPSTSVLSTVTITGIAGQFSCATTQLKVGQPVTISGTISGGTATISGSSYTPPGPTTYVIAATNGTTTFTLVTSAGGALTTTAGTTTGLTFTSGHAGTTLAFYVNPPDINNTPISQITLSTSTGNSGIPLGITIDSMGFSAIDDDGSEVNVEYTLTY